METGGDTPLHSLSLTQVNQPPPMHTKAGLIAIPSSSILLTPKLLVVTRQASPKLDTLIEVEPYQEVLQDPDHDHLACMMTIEART